VKTYDEGKAASIRRLLDLADMAELLARGERDPRKYSKLKREAATLRNHALREQRKMMERQNNG
jgi:hypothetical protein